MAKGNGENVLTPKFRVSYPTVFTSKYNNLSKRDEYSVTALFLEGETLNELKAVAKRVAYAKWPNKLPKNFKSPFKDQAEREDDETGEMPEGYVKGNKMLVMKTTRQPGIIDQKKNEIIDPDKFYAGCFARADVYCMAYEMEKGASRGVTFILNNLQFMEDGDPFSSRPKASDVFESVEGGNDEGGDPFGLPRNERL